MTGKLLLLLSVLQLLQHANFCLACREVFTVDGRPTSANSRGVFVSENFPHSLPTESYCVYEFKVQLSFASDVLCFRFKELELFTVNENSDKETQIMVGGSSHFDAVLIYTGNGSLLWERANASKFVHKWPSNLHNGPLCMHCNYQMSTHLVAVVNRKFYENSIGRMTRFYAEYEAMDSGTVIDNNSSFLGLHRCLDGSYLNESARCNSVIDCGRNNGQLYQSDFFAGQSSDESYEHARCNSNRSFGTNFALGQASAHSLSTWGTERDCRTDHSRQFPFSDTRDCSLKIRMGNTNSLPLYYWLYGIRWAANTRSASCYRLFWFSSGFTDDNEALTLSEPNGGRVLLRLPARKSFYSWSLAEIQLEPGFTNKWIYVHAFLSKQRNQTTAAHWFDDLSAEPAACDKSAYESRMPFVCSFEWSTCGWEATNLPVVTDVSVAKELRVSISDHTSISVPDRTMPPLPQRVLRLRPGTNFKGQLESKRRLAFDRVWCFEIWFNGVGYSGYSVTVEARISGILPNEFVLLTTTMPMNQWNRLSGTFMTMLPKSPIISVTMLAEDRYELSTVLLDDLSVFEGSCNVENNGSVQCGSNEWRCSNRQQCILERYRCDGRIHCPDASDELNCYERSGDYAWSLILRIVLGISVSVVAFLTLSICFRKRRLWWGRGPRGLADHSRAPPVTVSDGRLPPGLCSDRTRRRPDMPPSYEEVAAGASNSGFAADEEPPKYEEIIQVIQMREQQEQQQQQQESQPPQLPPRRPPRARSGNENQEESSGSTV
ncbi:hypothetical protein BOX15_Mlig012733g1 [Macrostomum lignano]|uniref:CUB domain-containing protein n=1 Tax=Macrostomum lignano TaxID=282301 RepID=A0A267FAD0_9PLAT|nr:hypothetical protein BOX15_Mlig012733g1 [Macrostomum lignano]